MSLLYHNADPVELQGQFRAASDGSSIFEGYTAVFDQWSQPNVDDLSRNGKPYRERIGSDAFRRTLGSGRRISLVVDHNERMMISSFPNGPLKLTPDSTGLHVESPWPRTDYADNVRALHEAGERLGMSMRFATPVNGDSWNSSHSERTVTEAILKHSAVLATMEPAYDGTIAQFRALADLTDAPVEDVDAVMEALREGRRLDDGEYNLLTRLTEAVRPEPVAPTMSDEDRAARDRWTSRLEEMRAELPTS